MERIYLCIGTRITRLFYFLETPIKIVYMTFYVIELWVIYLLLWYVNGCH